MKQFRSLNLWFRCNALTNWAIEASRPAAPESQGAGSIPARDLNYLLTYLKIYLTTLAIHNIFVKIQWVDFQMGRVILTNYLNSHLNIRYSGHTAFKLVKRGCIFRLLSFPSVYNTYQIFESPQIPSNYSIMRKIVMNYVSYLCIYSITSKIRDDC
jgi:hypothetical protein